MATHHTCDGIARRDFLKVGALTGVGLGLSDYLGLANANAAAGGRAKSAIYIRLAGGPSHMDTFDMKPDAPDTHRGEFRAFASPSICRNWPSAPTSMPSCAGSATRWPPTGWARNT